jgi:capsular polysaccharide biosynthesis protein
MPLKKTNAIHAPRIHYEQVVYNKLRILWNHRFLVTAVHGVALAALSVALLLIAPSYTGEAMIQLDFTRDQTIGGEKVQSTAAVDAAAVVGGAARIIRSRAIAGAVVSVLGLDRDPAYTRLSFPARVLSPVWSVLGLPAPTPRDIAVARLMEQTKVTNDPRSYLITVAVTTSDPERAAQLANWVASEYLRGRLREQAIEAYAVAEREMNALTSVFGPRHPSYLSGSAKLARLQAALAAARDGVVTEEREAVIAQDMIRFAAGHSLLPAEAVMLPSGPNILLLFVLTILAALAVGVLIASLAERGLLQRSIPLPAVLRAWSPAPLAERGLSWWRNSV